MITDPRIEADIEATLFNLFSRINEGISDGEQALLRTQAVTHIAALTDVDALMLRRWVDWTSQGMEMAITPWGPGEFAEALTQTIANGWNLR